MQTFERGTEDNDRRNEGSASMWKASLVVWLNQVSGMGKNIASAFRRATLVGVRGKFRARSCGVSGKLPGHMIRPRAWHRGRETPSRVRLTVQRLHHLGSRKGSSGRGGCQIATQPIQNSMSSRMIDTGASMSLHLLPEI